MRELVRLLFNDGQTSKQVIVMDTKQLEQHQIEAAARIVDTPELALWGAMGSGKTLTTLGAIQAIFDLDDAVGGGVDIAIVVGPRRWSTRFGSKRRRPSAWRVSSRCLARLKHA